MTVASFSLAVPGDFYSAESPLRTDEAGRPSSTTTQDISIFSYHEPTRSLERYFLGFNDQPFGTRALEITILSGDPSHLIFGWGANTNTVEYPGPITPDVDGTYLYGSGGIYSRVSTVNTLLVATPPLVVGDVISFKQTGFVYASGAIALNGTEYSFGSGCYEGLLVASTLGLEPGVYTGGGGGGGGGVGIRFPSELRLPDREGYADIDEETRTEFQPSTGAVRRRHKYRTTPRVFDVQWTFTQNEYSIFDYWVQYTIDGGAAQFDIQLLDDDETVVWYTVSAIGEFSYEILEAEGELRYQVRWRLRARTAHFGETRPASTDELYGRTTPEVVGSGTLHVYTPFRGLADVGILSAKARLNLLPLYGSIDVGMYSLPRARFARPDYPELSRVWQDLDWLSGGLAGQDIGTLADAVQREWMGV